MFAPAGTVGQLVPKGTLRVAELFAGVGGFRLALEGYQSEDEPELSCVPAGSFTTVWANQWEPPGTETRQFAWRCYERRFGTGSCVNRNITDVLDDVECGRVSLPDVDIVVGGFPCQDYSVAKPLSYSSGIEGKKGVLWWDILRFLRMKRPRLLLLENVDRLLKSPVKQRGRDFAVMLSCLQREGYAVEWRVINAADYGMPQKRRRVYLFGVRDDDNWNLRDRLLSNGVLATAFPVWESEEPSLEFDVSEDPYEMSETFGIGAKVSPFKNAGVMQHGHVLTKRLHPSYDGPYMTLGDIVAPDVEVPEQFFIPDEKLEAWQWQRSAKRVERTTREGFTYWYSEGAMSWPDPLDKPARTILTSEGGAGANRMKHAIRGDSGRIRRLTPDELDQIQMFPRGWTRGMSDGHRAFCMGNALVVGIPHAIGKVIARWYTSADGEG